VTGTDAPPSPPAFYNDLDATLSAAWDALARGVRDRKSGFHTGQLATLDAEGAPSVRTVVLRGVDRAGGWLQIHTDRRGPKPAEIERDARAMLHFYDAPAKIQLRVRGRASMHLDDAVADAAWAATRPFSRACYRVDPAPGAALGHPGEAAIPDGADPEAGRENFAVLRLHAVRMEWLYLAAAGHRRAVFEWDGAGRVEAAWLVP
jgi:hypothetical protein